MTKPTACRWCGKEHGAHGRVRRVVFKVPVAPLYAPPLLPYIQFVGGTAVDPLLPAPPYTIM